VVGTLIAAIALGTAMAQSPSPATKSTKTAESKPIAVQETTAGPPELNRQPLPTSVAVTTSADKPIHVRSDVTKDWMDKVTWIFTALLVLIGGAGVYAAVRTLRAIERQANLMEQQATEARTSSAQQMRDVEASIAEATRASKTMEGIAESMASNVESVKESVVINREIADRQKLATELQSRAYLSVFFNSATFQDANHVFEVQAVMRNHGNTPAYDVSFKAAAQIVPVPLPDDFSFPLPEEAAGASVSLMAPGTTKLLTRHVSTRVPDDQVDAIKLGNPPRGLAMWGVIKYRDAFKEARQIRFAFHVYWIPWIAGMDKDRNGNPLEPRIMSADTAHHNDAD